ncbi:MAG: hypothetical protein KF832_30405 [Caldilineaceae bacterium]|nr:hypothetical protein [Caldilineaceae bacterium]
MATYELFSSSNAGNLKVRRDQASIKLLFQKKHLAFIEYDVANDPEAHTRMIAISGRKDLPQFWVNGAFFGTYDDIAALEEVGDFDAKLSG